MPERDANQLAADVRAGLTEARHSGGSVEEGEEFKLGCPVCDAILALDELVGLVGTLQQERDEARDVFAIDLQMKARAEAAEKALDEKPISYPVQGGYVLIDHADLDLVASYKWSVQTDGRGREFALATSRATGKKRSVRMHRLILDATEGQMVDHVNGNTLDNRRSNLRLATAADNQRNKDHAESESGYKGVQKKQRGGWDASISVDGKIRTLGSYPSPAEAALVRDIAALELHGEFASTNYPREVLARIVSSEAALAEANQRNEELGHGRTGWPEADAWKRQACLAEAALATNDLRTLELERRLVGAKMVEEALRRQLATTRQALEPVRVFVEHFVPVEEALINGFNVDAWCELADRALADTGSPAATDSGDTKERA